MDLKTPVKQGGKIYKMYAHRLEKLGIMTFEDFLYHFPFRYEDYSLISTIDKVQEGETVTIIGKVLEIKNEYLRKWKTLQKAKVGDETETIDVTWFNQPYLVKTIKKDAKISLSGKINTFLKKKVMESPDYELIYENQKLIHTGGLIPVYPETKGISSKWLRRQIYKIMNENRQNLFEYLPYSIIKSNDLLGFIEALEQIHFPKSIENAIAAKQRLSFDELFLMQIKAKIRKESWKKDIVGNQFCLVKFKKQLDEFTSSLPFELTNAQKKAIDSITSDLISNKPMNRLLEGDVGSGKTVVSAVAMHLAFLNDYQSVLMAPTEILAQQHYQTISNLLLPFGVNIKLITGSSKPRIKEKHNSKFPLRPRIEASKIQNSADILIGTHAVLNEKINFDKLGLVIIDEQQRFGVEQRTLIRSKGKNPHFLTMTATPIPRTIALTLYGDLDLSVLDEMPKGRKTIKTWLVPKEKRENAYQWIKKQITNNKDQVFLICPFIEESESMQTVKAATKEYEQLQKEVFKNFKLGLLHGKLKAREKEIALRKFKDKEYNLLVATPVVEVGIDIPNATIILVEAAERFGLSQLHQLRGRVGRGEKQSYCLLFTESRNEQTYKRLKAMETMQIGAELAELDLKLRGPGEIYGTKQHGFTNLKIASFSDFKLIEKTKQEAKKIFPNLFRYPLLQEKLQMTTKKKISPD